MDTALPDLIQALKRQAEVLASMNEHLGKLGEAVVDLTAREDRRFTESLAFQIAAQSAIAMIFSVRAGRTPGLSKLLIDAFEAELAKAPIHDDPVMLVKARRYFEVMVLAGDDPARQIDAPPSE